MFQTKVEISLSPVKIGYEDHVMTLGSCFAENIGKKLTDAYFQVDVNPFGVLYNPVSIQNSIERLIENKSVTEADLFENRKLWQSFSHSSLFTDISPEGCLYKINSRLQRAAGFLQQANFILITFGTAWVFEDIESGRVVSNCHKLPATAFLRRRLTVEEIVAGYSKLINELTNKLPHLKLIFSVSPIRHWKDGAHENIVSKSTLLLAIDALQKQFDRVYYFPAYEIQLDELRDYRFYAADMLHPSDVAVDYIWSRFADTYFDDTTVKIKKELEQLTADLTHRPLHPESEEYQNFRANTEKRKTELIINYPFLEKRLK